jgi:hypothetical protein
VLSGADDATHTGNLQGCHCIAESGVLFGKGNGLAYLSGEDEQPLAVDIIAVMVP